MLFACIYVPDFPVEAALRAEPELRDQAAMVVDGKPPLLTVIAANEHARASGVEPGMTALQASARLAARTSPFSTRRRSLAQESSAHAALTDCARAFSPRVEECAAVPETLWLDLTGLERLFGPPAKIARDIARRASDLGMEVSVAVAANLEAATCAARGFTGTTVIAPGKEADRLALLSTDILLHSALSLSQTSSATLKSRGPHASTKPRMRSELSSGQLSPAHANEILETLDRWGVRTFRAMAALPEIAVSERLGPEGLFLLHLSRGEGSRTLAPTDSPLNFEEVLEFEDPVVDLESLAFVLNRLIEQLCTRLSTRALSTNELLLRLHLEPCLDRDIRGAQEAAYSSVHPFIRSSDCYERSIRLPVPMLDARTFLRLWQLELRSNPPAAPVRKISLRAEPVQPRHTQAGLFLPTAPEPERLEVTLARITSVVRPSGRSLHRSSDSSLCVGSAEVLDTHRPGAFRMKRFLPPASDALAVSRPHSVHSVAATAAGSEVSGNSTTALRVFRPPLPVSVDTSKDRPVHIVPSEGSAACVGFDVAGRISWCAGPWRTSGEWWNEPWSRDEWDVAIETASGRMLCRLYRDATNESWYMAGTYD